ncbi:MAG: hypothetical protein WAN74_00650 [Thermoplasmata archaeon]
MSEGEEIATSGDRALGGPRLEIQHLSIGVSPKLDLAFGEARGLVAWVDRTPGVSAIVWNEGRIGVICPDLTTEITFEPEIAPEAEQFFQHAQERDGEGTKIWSGDCEPVWFSRADLLKFVRQHQAQMPENVQEALRALKVRTSSTHDNEMLSLDAGSGSRTVEEERTETNVPKRFTLRLPLADGFSGDLDIEAEIGRKKDRYGNPEGAIGIRLRCVNARQVLRDLMGGVLKQLPPDIPQYYGRSKVQQPSGGGRF